MVSGVWFGVSHLGVAVDLAPPVFPTGARISQKLGKLDGPHLGPDALGPPEIGDAAFRADPGAGEHHQISAGANQGSKLLDLRFELLIIAASLSPIAFR